MTNSPGNYGVPTLISWNLTRQCNLRCPHCYLDATPTPEESELSPEEALRVIDQIVELSPGAMVVFSGGEPLLRPDLPQLIRHASGKGLMPVLGTNGTLLDGPMIEALVACGLMGAGISLDSPTPDYHDSFRGMKGAWQGTVNAMEGCRRLGLPYQVQTSLSRENLPYLEDMVKLSNQTGAAAFNLFFLVCTGRGESLTDITPQEYEQALNALATLQGDFPAMMLRARCAPHFTRLLAERGISEAELPVGCLAGSGYLRLTPNGEVTPCPYLPLPVGNLRHQGLAQIWTDSPVLKELRAEQWRGRCGICSFATRCRGCRARAFALSGDYLGEDPWCTYQPPEGKRDHRPARIPWQEEAWQRMQRAPGFIRERVIAHIEAYARERGYPEVTVQVMEEVRGKSPHGRMLPFRHPQH